MVWWERQGRLQFQCKYQKLWKTVTSAENGGGTTGITDHQSSSQKNRSCPKTPNKDKKDCKNQRGRPVKKGGDNNEGGGNGKKNKDTTPKRIVVVKTEWKKDANSTPASPTPAVTRQRARMSKKGNDDNVSTHKIRSEDELEDDAFLEELFNTPMESLDSSESSSDESDQWLPKFLWKGYNPAVYYKTLEKRGIL